MNQNPDLVIALASLKDMLGKINENHSTADLNTTIWNRPIDRATLPSVSEIDEIFRRSDSTCIHFDPEYIELTMD